MHYTGTDGSIEVNGEQLLLHRFGAVSRVGGGWKPSTRVIPLAAISGVRFKEPGRIVNGYLQLLLGGQDRPEPKAVSMDPNAVRMTFSQKDAWVQLAQWVEHVVHTNRVNGIDPASIPYDGAPPTPEPQDAQAATLAGGVDDWPAAEPGVSATAGRPDIEQAAARMGWKLGGRREIKKLPEHLYAGEQVAFIAQGAYNNDQGIVAMTSQRLIFVFHGMVRQAVEDFALDRITTVQHKTGLATGTLRVTVSGRTVEISQILKQDLLLLAEALRKRIASGAPQPAPPQDVPPPHAVSNQPSDPVEALRKLGDLHKAGIVTDDEFAAKKAELLARM